MLQTNKNNIECRIHASLPHLLGDKNLCSGKQEMFVI